MKTILHSIDTTGPGGAETVFTTLASGLPQSRFRSLAVIRGTGWVYDELHRLGIQPQILESRGSFNWRYLSALVALIRREQVDLVQSHLLGSNVYCSLAGALTGVPVVATFHGNVDIGAAERFKGLKFRIINRGASCTVAVSEALRTDIIHSTPLRASASRVIHNGIDCAAFQRPRRDELRQRFGWAASDLVIGCLGNIRPAKGYDILLAAAVQMRERVPGVRIVIAGQPGRGDLYDRLQQMRTELGLQETVQFIGFIDDPAGFLANLDLFMLSSVTEGFSIATIQAMAAGLPVLVTQSGGPQEIVTHGVNGWMVPPGDPDSLAAAVARLAADPALRTSLAEAGKEHVNATFDIGVMLNAYCDIYDTLF